MSNKKETDLVPRRDFLKYSSTLTAAAAYTLYLTTDAKGEKAAPLVIGGGGGADAYTYLDP